MGFGKRDRRLSDIEDVLRGLARGDLKTALRIGGIVIALMGLMFLPSRDYVLGRSDLSAFHNWADVGVTYLSGDDLPERCSFAQDSD